MFFEAYVERAIVKERDAAKREKSARSESDNSQKKMLTLVHDADNILTYWHFRIDSNLGFWRAL